MEVYTIVWTYLELVPSLLQNTIGKGVIIIVMKIITTGLNGNEQYDIGLLPQKIGHNIPNFLLTYWVPIDSKGYPTLGKHQQSKKLMPLCNWHCKCFYVVMVSFSEINSTALYGCNA